MWPHNPATRFRPPSATVVSAEPFSHRTGTLRCLQKEVATYRHWSVFFWQDADDVSHVESCRLTKLNGGLSLLHSVDEDAVSWLTSYGSWHAYEKNKKYHVPVYQWYKQFCRSVNCIRLCSCFVSSLTFCFVSLCLSSASVSSAFMALCILEFLCYILYPLMSWKTVVLECYGTVGKVIWRVKSSANWCVSSETLNLYHTVLYHDLVMVSSLFAVVSCCLNALEWMIDRNQHSQ